MSDINTYGVSEFDLLMLPYRPLETIEEVFKRGYDVNKLSTDVNDETFMMRVVLLSSKDQSVIKRMQLALEYGADINKKRSSGQTVLDYAVLTGRKEAVQFLLDHGADIYNKGYKGRNMITTLHCRIYNKYYTGCQKQRISGCLSDDDKCGICLLKEILDMLYNHDKKIKSLFELMIENIELEVNKKQRIH